MPHHYAATVFYFFHYKVHKTNTKRLNHVCPNTWTLLLGCKVDGVRILDRDSVEVHLSYNMYPVNLLTYFRNPWYRVFPQQTCPWHPLDIEVDIEINVHVKKCVKQNRFMYQIPGCEWYKVKVSRHPSPCTNINTRDFTMKYCFHFFV